MKRLIVAGMVVAASVSLGVWFYGWAMISCRGAVEMGDTCIDLGMSGAVDAPIVTRLPLSR